MPDKDRIVDEVRTALDALYPDPNHGNGNFGTSEVLTALCKACRACDPASFLCTKKKDVTAVAVNNGEWLYDLTCLIYDGDGYLIISLWLRNANGEIRTKYTMTFKSCYWHAQMSG